MLLYQLAKRLRGPVDEARWCLEAVGAIAESVPSLALVPAADTPKPSNAAAGVTASSSSSSSSAAAAASLVSVLLSAQRWALVQEAAEACLSRVCACGEVRAQLGDALARDLADGLRISAQCGSFAAPSSPPSSLKQQQQQQQAEKARHVAMLELVGPLARLVKGLCLKATRGGANNNNNGGIRSVFPCWMLHLVLPVVEALLSLPSVLPGCELGFVLFDL